jgi:hypothetical protein
MFYADHFCAYEEITDDSGHFYVFSGPCKLTRKMYSVKVPAEGLYRYRRGALIQDAFPEMPKEDREFLVSGFTPEAWAQMFPLGSDDEEDETKED